MKEQASRFPEQPSVFPLQPALSCTCERFFSLQFLLSHSLRNPGWLVSDMRGTQFQTKLAKLQTYTFTLYQKVSSKRFNRSVYMKRIKLVAMIIMPPIRPPMAKWCSPYSSAVGKSSSRDMYTIIPATAAKTKPKVVLVNTALRRK